MRLSQLFFISLCFLKVYSQKSFADELNCHKHYFKNEENATERNYVIGITKNCYVFDWLSNITLPLKIPANNTRSCSNNEIFIVYVKKEQYLNRRGNIKMPVVMRIEGPRIVVQSAFSSKLKHSVEDSAFYEFVPNYRFTFTTPAIKPGYTIVKILNVKFQIFVVTRSRFDFRVQQLIFERKNDYTFRVYWSTPLSTIPRHLVALTDDLHIETVHIDNTLKPYKFETIYVEDTTNFDFERIGLAISHTPFINNITYKAAVFNFNSLILGIPELLFWPAVDVSHQILCYETEIARIRAYKWRTTLNDRTLFKREFFDLSRYFNIYNFFKTSAHPYTAFLPIRVPENDNRLLYMFIACFFGILFISKTIYLILKYTCMIYHRMIFFNSGKHPTVKKNQS